ncbi:PREDICTED: uncharacterized protein LOC104737947 isoform X2 [Camelina sativa]|uniref:Uncharacterized protein LOC104737947 isoform X2 n=1 Tax=Camelina sativa TaxID=90675 RepID=A0ABM0VA46_CAMSA|nr:PREDICTED: uncharacterized protein LOC104737947 isoform X2 [Camelina sativa]
MMKANQKPKTHAPPRPLFSCGFFRRCTQSVLSPTSPHQQQPRRKPTTTSSSSSSSSTSTSQSFTQWRFPHHLDQTPSTAPSLPPPPPLPVTTTLQETFQIAELHLTSVSESDKLLALQLLERVVVPDPPSDPTCPPGLMRGLVSCLRSNNKIVTAKYVTKILLALCLAEGNRHVAVEAGAARAVVETAAGLEISAVERALAALELMCTTKEGAAEVRAHAMTVPAMVAVMARLAGRGREYAISILSVVYGKGGDDSGEEIAVAPAEEVARAVALALEGGECTARGRRKGTQLLKTLEEYGRLDLSQNGT